MKEWYLMQPPTMIGGEENDSFLEFKDDAFNELLGTDFASDIEICNYDLSETKQIRAIIQNKTSDTELQSLGRQMLAPIGTCKAGMYVKYKNRYWLIVGLVDDNMVYEKAVLSLCNQKLMWINHKGKVVQRWANVVSASQYNNGETNMRLYFVRSDQLLVSLPDDDESLSIPHGHRFIIDKRCRVYEKQFDGTVLKDTGKPVTTYQLTRSDTVLYNYGDSGHMEFIATQDEKHEDDGYYVVDGTPCWLCGVPKNNTDKKQILSPSIIYDSADIYNGIEPGVFIAEFLDADGNVADIIPKWTVNCDFADRLKIIKQDNSIIISADDTKLVNKSFGLSLDGDGYTTTSITVTIKPFL